MSTANNKNQHTHTRAHTDMHTNVLSLAPSHKLLPVLRAALRAAGNVLNSS